MKKGTFSIRATLIITISVLTLMVASFALKETYIEGNRMHKIRALRDANIISNQMFEFTEKSSVVRDLTTFILYASDKETIDKLKPKLELSRNEADESLNAVLEATRKYNNPEFSKIIADTQSEFTKLKATRLLLDMQIYQPMSEQKRKAAESWFTEATSMIVQNQKLWIEFIKQFADIDPAVILHMRFKHFLGVIIEYTGRERAIIGRLIVENAAAKPQEQSNLLQWHGAVEMGWDRINSLAEQSGLNPVLKPYIKDAQSHYTTVYEMVRDIFYIPGVKNKVPSPISVDVWLAISSQATDSIYELKNASLIQTQAYVDKLEDKAKELIIANIILLCASIALCLYSFRIIFFRVLSPINYMVNALLDTASGKQVTMQLDMTDRDDEIGKLNQVLISLQRSSERYRSLVEASSSVIWAWQPDDISGMAELTKWWEGISGQPAELLLPSGWLNDVHPDDRERAAKAWADSSQSGENFHLEYRIKRQNGKYIHVSSRGVPMKNPDGSLREIIGALNDITIRKEAELQINLYMADLERSNKELDDFAYIASHDLKEPLRGIHNHARFLMEDNQEKLDADSVSRLGRLIYLSQRMERLVNDLLYFSRLGRQELAIKQTDINEVISDIESTIDIFLKEHNGKIIIPEKLPQIICDKTRVTELFRNLITNAIKYNDQADKIVEIGFIKKHATKNCELIQNVFYVKDNGHGIAEEFYTEIFRIFKRLQSPKDKAEEGTGVGLTFVKKIVERHGGIIWLESEISKGTTFYFTLEGTTNGKNPE